jgi:hypothetical protein
VGRLGSPALDRLAYFGRQAFFFGFSIGRLPLFGEIVAGDMHLNLMGWIARREWERLPGRSPFLEIGSFVVMPNHIHGILILGTGTDDCGGTARHENAMVMDSPRHAPTADQAMIMDNPRRASVTKCRGTADHDEATVAESLRAAKQKDCSE